MARSRRKLAKDGRDLPTNEVVAHVLAAQLVHHQPTGAIRIRKADLQGLLRKVEQVLDAPHGAAVRRKVTTRSLDERVGAKRSTARVTGKLSKPAPTRKTADLGALTGEDVLRAARAAFMRAGGTVTRAEISVTEVVTDLLADHLVPRLDSDPDLMDFDGDDLLALSNEVQNVLPSLRLESPWRYAIGPVYRTDTLVAVLGLASRDDLMELVNKKTVLMMHTSDGHEVFPCFQVASGHLLPGLAEVLQVSPDLETAPWTTAAWLRTPLQMLGGQSIVDALVGRDEVAAVRAATMIWGGNQE
jgi:hypothetical protein